MSRNVIWKLPLPSLEFDSGPVIRHQFDKVVLSYDLEVPDGGYVWEEVVFTGVKGYRLLAFDRCGEEHLDAYDAIIEVEAFDWIRPSAGLLNLRIFLDETGCLDVQCSGYEIPTDGGSA